MRTSTAALFVLLSTGAARPLLPHERWRRASSHARALSDAFVLPTNSTPRSCPCASLSLCEPITGPPIRPGGEVYGFLGATTAASSLNWTHISTVAWSPDDATTCAAHFHGARALLAAPTVDLGALRTAAERETWVNKTMAQVRARFLDGVVFDYESPLAAGSDGVGTYTALVAATRDALHAANPSYQISVCVAWSPDDIDGRAYNNAALAAASDLTYVMDYDTRSQIFDACIASANAPLGGARQGIQRYLDVGVPARKLVLGVPWYGYRYPCVAGTEHGARFCPIRPVPFRGVNCSDAAGSEHSFKDIRAVQRGPAAATALRWDDSMSAPFFNAVENGTVVQYWFDDARSLGLKYAFARSAGLGGVGPFTFDDLDHVSAPEDARGMWAALDRFFMGWR